jgi:hypothetical protein
VSLLSVSTAAWLSVACTGSSGGLAPASDETGDDDDDDQPDEPVPVSGSYLTCYVPKPAPGDEEVYAGCQVRGKDKQKVDISKSDAYTWSYVPAQGAQDRPVKVYDLARAKSSFYFHVVYSLPIPKATGLSLAEDAARSDAIKWFLDAAPLLWPRVSLMSEINKKPTTGTGSGTTTATSTSTGTQGSLQAPLRLTDAAASTPFGVMANRATTDTTGFFAVPKELTTVPPAQSLSASAGTEVLDPTAFTLPTTAPTIPVFEQPTAADQGVQVFEDVQYTEQDQFQNTEYIPIGGTSSDVEYTEQPVEEPVVYTEYYDEYYYEEVPQ